MATETRETHQWGVDHGDGDIEVFDTREQAEQVAAGGYPIVRVLHRSVVTITREWAEVPDDSEPGAAP